MHAESGVEMTDGFRNTVKPCIIKHMPKGLLCFFPLEPFWNPFCIKRAMHVKPFKFELICKSAIKSENLIRSVILSFPAITLIVVTLIKCLPWQRRSVVREIDSTVLRFLQVVRLSPKNALFVMVC